MELFALVVWNIGSRSPMRVVRDMWGALVRRRGLFSSAVRILIGIIFFVAALVMLLPVIDDLASDLLPMELLTIVAALAIELLLGDDLRDIAVGRKTVF